MTLIRTLSPARKTTAQLFALCAGLTYLLVGLLGMSLTRLDFSPPQGGGESTLLIFAVNVLHNLLHLAVGALWIVAAQRRGWARTTNLLLGIAYATLAVLGFSGMLQFLAIHSWFDPDNLLHLATAIAAISFSSVVAERRLAFA
jgi:hypothetical protein